jgi:hypothetical protein
MRSAALAVAVTATIVLTGCQPAVPFAGPAAGADGAGADVAPPEPELHAVIRREFAAVGAEPHEQEWAIRIAGCESGNGNPATLDPRAVSRGKGNLGLFQINWRSQRHRVRALGFDKADLFDPVANARVAADLWAERGQRFAGSSGWPACSRRLRIP